MCDIGPRALGCKPQTLWVTVPRCPSFSASSLETTCLCRIRLPLPNKWGLKAINQETIESGKLSFRKEISGLTIFSVKLEQILNLFHKNYPGMGTAMGQGTSWGEGKGDSLWSKEAQCSSSRVIKSQNCELVFKWLVTGDTPERGLEQSIKTLVEKKK